MEYVALYKFQNWGLIDYAQALALQEKLVADIAEKDQAGVIVFCSHPPVVTIGRGTKEGDVFAWQGPTIEISRGGRATYHGPSQLIIYPIINLNRASRSRPAKDIGAFLRNFETAIVRTLQEYGISSEGRSFKKKSELEAAVEETGVWVGNQKIASLGIGVRKWVSFHGAAINLDQDPLAFQGLRPCGFGKETMVSLQKLTGTPVDREQFAQRLYGHLGELL
ncbi:MAG: lipoyl(octanoyl) transferase LipB [Pseudobdellovibrionaceae bacterium]